MRSIVIFLSVFASLTAKAQSDTKTVLTIPEPDLIPECITYSESQDRFFVGSIFKRKIISIDKSGNIKTFTDFNTSGIKSVAGIKIDENKNELYAVTAQAGYKSHTAPDKWSIGLFRYDILTGRLLEKIVLEDSPSMLNDLCLDPQGNLYITDSRAGAIYTKKPGESSLQLLFDTATFDGPNGIVYHQSKLFIATAEGIWVVDLPTKGKQLLKIKNGENAGEIDGLYRYKNSLIGVQNGVKPKRIIRIDLADNLNETHTLTVLEKRDEPLNIFSPTTGTILRDYFYYMANAQVRSMDSNENVLVELRPVLIKKIRLK